MPELPRSTIRKMAVQDPMAVADRVFELEAERDRLREDVEAAHWTIDKVRERIIAASKGDLTALFEEVDRLCLSFQQTQATPASDKEQGPS